MKPERIHTRICLLLLWIIGLSVLAACQPDIDENLELGAPVNVVVTTRATTQPDAQVKRLRLIATGWNATNTGSVSYNQLIESPGTAIGFNVKARKGDNNFYLVANETPAMTAALAAVKTANELEQLKVNFEPLAASESPMMFGAMKKVKVDAADTDTQATVTYTDATGMQHTNQATLPLTLVRTQARFSLTFIKNSDAFTVKNINFKVLRIPAYALLGVEQPYPGTAWSAETLPQSSTGALTDNNTATWNAGSGTYTFGNAHRVDFTDFYLPQHLLTEAHRGDVDFCTVLIVNGTCVMPGGREQDANWRIDLMTNNFSIKRNTHYKIAATISGMGAMGMSTEVMPVTQHDIPVNWGTPDGLVVVSDRTADYDKNVNIANDVTAYSGLLKVVKNVNGRPTYHNVLFKQGSIVGIAAKASTTGIGYTPATDVIYDPALAGHTYNTNTWTAIPTSTSSIASTDNTLTELRAGHGDPCQLIGVTPGQMQQGRYTNGLWHTATTEELQRLIANGDYKIDGTTTADTRGLLAYHQLLLPTTAHRNNSGTLTAATNWGYYLSSTPGQVLSFDATDLTSPKLADFSANAQSAYTVRCVRNTIPASTLTATATSVGYQGGAFTINVRSNVPYWTATAVTTGDLTGVTFTNASGKFNGSVSGTVAARPLTSDRQFTIRISGNGYDGTPHTQDLVIIQRGFMWSLSKVSDQLPTTIPQAGGTYTAAVKLGPDDVSFPQNGATVTLTMQINGVNQPNPQTANIDASTRRATFSYTVPANDTGVSRMMSFVFRASVGGNATATSSVMQNK